MTQKEIKDEAEAFRLDMINGRATVAQVVSWADKIIQDCSDAPYEVIDIASSGDCSNADMVSKLSAVPGE
jgi:hypothetical protein